MRHLLWLKRPGRTKMRAPLAANVASSFVHQDSHVRYVFGLIRLRTTCDHRVRKWDSWCGRVPPGDRSRPIGFFASLIPYSNDTYRLNRYDIYQPTNCNRNIFQFVIRIFFFGSISYNIKKIVNFWKVEFKHYKFNCR